MYDSFAFAIFKFPFLIQVYDIVKFGGCTAYKPLLGYLKLGYVSLFAAIIFTRIVPF